METKRVIGIDWGKSKIGLALGDTESRLASPLKTVKTWPEVKALIDTEAVELIVLGHPVSLSGQTDKFTSGFAEFSKHINTLGLPVYLVDERFSSKAAQHLQHQGGKKNAADEDALAAMLILQSWLDQQ